MCFYIWQSPYSERNTGLIGFRKRLFDIETLLEAIHTAAAVHQLLFAGKERMALGADFYLQLRLSGTGFKRLTAYAMDDCLAILGMDFLFHAVSPLLRMPVSGSQNRET